ncbi:NAD-dependent deacetylase [Nocardiopsis mangrovi]|uniref:protein acetyllysine N-acetyltransferase n=1 Tax=Nocardiopsis mangrovi TaxID=1179818 RepID=A0ABV9DZY0_9ACTN
MNAASDRARAVEIMASADRVTVLTGAGVSTDSGIPDYRGPQGVWTKNPGAEALSDLNTYMSDADVRREVWRMRRSHAVWAADPNAAHAALTDLDRAGRLHAVVTQNIDGLHQAAGTDPARVIEVHGTVHWVVCMECDERTPMPEVLTRLEDESDPRCLLCGGIQKSATISFGQRLDPDVIQAAVDATADAGVFVAIGTSLMVNPVAGLCDIARQNGVPLIIVNAEPTPYDPVAEVVLRDPIGEVVPELVREVLADRAE